MLEKVLRRFPFTLQVSKLTEVGISGGACLSYDIEIVLSLGHVLKIWIL
jgi:hypothetical protein